MTAARAPLVTAADDRAGRAVQPLRPAVYRQRWLYLLVALTAIGNGAGAGQAVYAALAAGRTRWATGCMALYHLGPPGALNAARAEDWTFCVGRFNTGQGLAMVLGAAVVPLAVLLATLLGALVVRRRLRTGASSGPGVAVIGARFAHWCTELGLTGRRRPDLVVLRPGRRRTEAFTTALPFGRSTVVIPVGHAHLGRAHLDLVLLHELAHVRARDLTWAAATWWTGWLTIPVLVASLSPLAAAPRLVLQFFGLPLATAAALTLTTLILRAAVLRRREQSADRYAVVRGDCWTALRDARVVVAARRAPGPLRRLVATHPPLAARARAALADQPGWEAGFAVALVAGLLAMFTGQWLNTLLIDLMPRTLDTRWTGELSLAAATLVWAATVVPVWAGARGAGRWARWSRTAGAATGLVAGLYLQPTGTFVPVGVLATGGSLWRALAWSILPMTAAALCAVELAAAVAVTRPGRRRLASGCAAVLAAATVLTTVAAIVRDVLQLLALHPDAALLRINLNTRGDVWWWRWTPLVLLACAVVMIAAGPGLRRAARAVAAPLLVATACGAAIGIVTGRLYGDPAQRFLLLSNTWWICGAAGAAAAIATRRHRLPVMLAAGAATAATAGVVLVASGVKGDLALFVEMPVWWAVLLTLLIGPVAAVRRRPLRPAGRWAVLFVGAVLVPVLIGSGALAPVVGERNDPAAADRPAAPAVRIMPDLDAVRPESAADPGRVLGQAEATALVGRLRDALSPAWSVVPEQPDTPPGPDVQPPVCAEQRAANFAAAAARTMAADAALTMALPFSAWALDGATLAIDVGSLPTVGDSGVVLARQERQIVACAEWTTAASRTDDRLWHQTEALRPAPLPGYPGVAMRSVVSAHVWTMPITYALVQHWVVVGHNVVTVAAYCSATTHETPAAAQWAALEELVGRTTRLAVAGLGGA